MTCVGVCVGTFVGDDRQAGQELLKGDIPVLVLVEDGKDAVQEKAITKTHGLLKVGAIDILDGAVLPADATEVEPVWAVCEQGATWKC
jgi:hypothetical protein